MHDIPEEAVKAAKDVLYYANPNDVERALTAALPHLPGVGVKALPRAPKDQSDIGWTLPIHLLEELRKEADGWADEISIEGVEAIALSTERRILSALEPSAARELALEEGYRQGIEAAAQKAAEMLVFADTTSTADREIPAAIRALSSPDHADAGKVEGDARADLERFWRPISEADRTITYEDTFNLGDGKSMTIRNSDHFWVRDADGRVYEATWSDHKGGYWWDLEGESRVDPVEYMPHPLSLPSALSAGGE